jgi:hypothetical protein
MKEDLSAVWGSAVATAITEMQSTPWISFPFESPWRNYSAIDPSWQNVQYRRVGDQVQLRGLANRNNGAGQVLGYLPAGYRPLLRLHHTSVCDPGHTYVVIEVSGQIWFTQGPSANGWVTLDPVKFMVS